MRIPMPWRRLATACALVTTLLLLSRGIASAHAHLVQADPAPDSVIAAAPHVATFVFDEPLNPALTRVRVTTAAGVPVTTTTGDLAPGHNGKLWQLPLPALRPGTYSVIWISESATDGHVMSSFYTFRVASSGGTTGVGAVTGTAGGVYGGGGGGGGGRPGGAVAVALATWLGLMAQALWLGAVVIDLAVLGPARYAGETPEGRLASAATRPLWMVMRVALVVVLVSLGAEVLSLALAGTGGDWSRAVAPATLGGILSGQNGRLLQARVILLVLALPLAAVTRVPATAAGAASAPLRQRARGVLGLTAAALPVPLWVLTRGTLLFLAATYMRLVAMSGHAADVTPAWLSDAIDWLHLIGTAAWAGGIAALAYAVLPRRRALPADQRAAAVLPLLDRFSPVAYTSVGVLAASGLYNAVNHLDAPSLLASTLYGQVLVLKLGLVGLLIVLSATHVMCLRPRIARAQGLVHRGAHAAHGARAVAVVHEGLATLAARLRLEAGVGAAILLATALMGQTLPAHSAPARPASALPTVPASITGSATMGDLRGQLTLAPPAVGATTITLSLRENGVPLTGGTAAAIIHLFPAAHPALRATLDPVEHNERFTVRGSLAAAGAWRADVLVRTLTVNDYRTLPFTFTVGPGASFLAPGVDPDALTMTVTPGLLSAFNTITVGGVQARAVRLLSQSLDMRMGAVPVPMTDLGGGHWRASGILPPMLGHWALTVQAQRARGWSSLRRFVYVVPFNGPMRLLIPPATRARVTAQTGTRVWTPVRGPRTVIHALVRAPWGALYAGTSQGIFASTDRGATWHPVGSGFGGGEAWGIAAVRGPQGDAILVAANDGFVYRLPRGGGRWTRAVAAIGAQGAFAVYALPHPGAALAGSDHGIFRSVDGGRSWRRVASTAGGAVVVFARDPANGTLYAGLAGLPRPLRMSVDDGANWRTPPAPLPPPSVEALLAVAGRMYAGVMGPPGGRVVWVGGGRGFVPRASGLPRAADGMVLAAINGTPPHLLLGTMGLGVYRTTPEGRWARLGQGPGDGIVTSLLVVPGTHPIVLAGTAAGIYRLHWP